MNQQEGVRVPEDKLLIEIVDIVNSPVHRDECTCTVGAFGRSATCSNCTAIKILTKIREVVEGAGLTDEEIESIELTQDDKDELDSMATIGLSESDPDAKQEYVDRLNMLYHWRLKHNVAQAQLQAILKAIKEDK